MPFALQRLPAGAAAGSTLGLVMVVLMSAFLLVLQQAVRQGETRRRTTALLAEATWRCKALRAPSLRQDCLARLETLGDDDAGLKQMVLAMASADRPPPH